jgi:hypothetical protein
MKNLTKIVVAGFSAIPAFATAAQWRSFTDRCLGLRFEQGELPSPTI